MYKIFNYARGIYPGKEYLSDDDEYENPQIKYENPQIQKKSQKRMYKIFNYARGICPGKEYLSDDDEYENPQIKYENPQIQKKIQNCEDPPGFPIVEVFNIIYLGQDEVKPEKQLGTINFSTCTNDYNLYKVEEVDLCKPTIRYGDVIPLTIKTPSYGILDDYVDMDFDLFCGAFKGGITFPWSGIENGASLNCVRLNSNDNTGQILVNLGAFINGTIANLELKLVNNSAPVSIYGSIYASNANLNTSNAASFLFHQKLDNGLKVGLDGVIPLSKSVVGVPLFSQLYLEFFLYIDGHPHTAILSFDSKETGKDIKSMSTNRKAKILVNVSWGDFQHCEVIYHENNKHSAVNQRMLRTSSVGRSVCEAEENFYLHYDRVVETIKYEPSYHLSSVTITFLSWLSTTKVEFRADVVEMLHPVVLFNIIQVANYFQIKSLMDLACRKLADKIKTKAFKEIMEEFSMDGFYIRTKEHVKSIAYPEAYIKNILRELKDSIKFPRMNVDSILRQRGKEALINRSHLVDVPIYPIATERLPLVKKRSSIFDRCVGDFMEGSILLSKDNAGNLNKLLEATRWLNNLIDGDLGFADCLSSSTVKRLLEILRQIYIYKDRRSEVISIQILAVRVLSRALSRSKYHPYVKGAVPAFVMVMSEPLLAFNYEGVIALTHLAYAYPDSKSVIFENGALEKALKIATTHDTFEILCCVATFLAVVCSTNFPEDKVEVALHISEIIFESKICSTYQHVVSACYALQYLTYGRSVESGELWNKIIRKLVGVICNCFPVGKFSVVPSAIGIVEVAGSALGVIGNIARWGRTKQIKILTRDKDSKLVRCLGEILCSGFNKFSKEACRIILNIAARGEIWIQDMHEAKLIEPLCSLLETDMYESDVKMEAAWAIFNGIYGNTYRPIDVYPREMI